jgi:hypothetical protein
MPSDIQIQIINIVIPSPWEKTTHHILEVINAIVNYELE